MTLKEYWHKVWKDGPLDNLPKEATWPEFWSAVRAEVPHAFRQAVLVYFAPLIVPYILIKDGLGFILQKLDG